ncbi:MAG: hypothetical protein JWP35_3542 [Caulobacter sp.]|nr:hypothetical protein [Caulobacter sp.]
MNRYAVWAEPGRTVLDPTTRAPIPTIGDAADPHVVEWDSYWDRRLADGDITRDEAPADDAKGKAPKRQES